MRLFEISLTIALSFVAKDIFRRRRFNYKRHLSWDGLLVRQLSYLKTLIRTVTDKFLRRFGVMSLVGS